ncbi:MAG TPA: kynureninase, partial [Rhizomicrobium sp.]|nr:kynureninase [Rhizomicrobium sp.]
MNRAACLERDAQDPLAPARDRFAMPEGVIYLDGNSLGPVPKTTKERLARLIDHEWGEDLITSWNRHDWIGLPSRVGARVAPLIGAQADEVIVADSTSVNLFKLAAGAVRLKSPRFVVLTETRNFPTDLYVLQGLEDMLGGAVELRMVPREELRDALDEDTALVALTHTDYKTGAIHDMRALNRAAHAAGALTLWDLSHSAGAMELFLDRDGADLAIGCGYKYLNGGPGAPAYLYVAKKHQALLRQPLSGWMGHAAPFDFSEMYRPADGMLRHLCGTQAVLSMAALEEGLKTFDGIDMAAVRAKSQALGDLFLELVEARCGKSGFEIACPREGRGSQVSLRHKDGYAIMQAMIASRVIGDFRAPDFMRFGFAP